MKGFCEINGLDAYENYGVVFEKGTYNEVFSLPVPKDRYTYDWGGEDGLEVDEVSPIVRQARQLTLPMLQIADTGEQLRDYYNAFRTELYSKVYHDFVFKPVNVRMKLRMTGGGGVTTIGSVFRTGQAAIRIPIQFSDDLPRILPVVPATVFNQMIFNDIILF